jgi:hypothetical protein
MRSPEAARDSLAVSPVETLEAAPVLYPRLRDYL